MRYRTYALTMHIRADVRFTQMLAIGWHTIDDRYLAPSDELDGTALGH